jgi:4-aminobutyrate aminotransferase-like enzyme
VECADGPTTNRVVLAAQSRGVLVYWFLSTPQAFRIAPPLTLKDEELEWAITQLLAALDTASQPD